MTIGRGTPEKHTFFAEKTVRETQIKEVVESLLLLGNKIQYL